MDRKMFLHLGTGHELDKGPCLIRMFRIGADAVEPSAQGGGASPFGKTQEGRHADLSDDLRILRIIRQAPRIRPIAMKHRVALEKYGEGLGLLIGQRGPGRQPLNDLLPDESHRL